MQKKFDNPGAVAMEMPFKIGDGLVALFPNCLLINQLFRDSLAVQNLSVDASDEHLFVIGAIEDADLSARGQIAYGAPQEVMIQFLPCWLFETVNFTTLRINPGHHMFDGAVFSRRVHRLKDQKNCIAAGSV